MSAPSTQSKRGPKLKPTAPKPCEKCGKPMERRHWASGRVETVASFKRRKFCSLACTGEAKQRKVHGFELCLMCGTVRPDAALKPSESQGWRRCLDEAWCAGQAEVTP